LMLLLRAASACCAVWLKRLSWISICTERMAYYVIDMKKSELCGAVGCRLAVGETYIDNAISGRPLHGSVRLGPSCPHPQNSGWTKDTAHAIPVVVQVHKAQRPKTPCMAVCGLGPPALTPRTVIGQKTQHTPYLW
jgi:hypothetical protein